MSGSIPDPKLDLVLEREIDVPAHVLWAAWTRPEHLSKWFAPAPWTIVHCDIDVRPGGKFHFVMRSPEGQDYPTTGCYLEVVENRRLVWTDALLPGYRPSENPFFTAVVTMAPAGNGTRYKAVAVHRDEATRKKHEEMGFHEGWGQVLEQMVEFARTM
jgi:uncharacterized protein YndB with AHSA1/START domain